MSRAGRVYRGSVVALSSTLIVLGLVIIVRTAVAGSSGPAVGYLIGAGMIAVGVLRLYVARKT